MTSQSVAPPAGGMVLDRWGGTQGAHSGQAEQQRKALRYLRYEMARTYDLLVESWVEKLLQRDHETAGHTRRVTEMTLQLARALDVPRSMFVHIRRGALLHDIGKLWVPDAILHKPGELTAEEWEVMRRHPVYARDLLIGVDALHPALDIPYSHHERWDGGGYPLGLAGVQIPLAARIFAVVDVWDALRSDRPYKQAYSIEESCRQILVGSGSHFDPHVVETFLRVVTPP